MAGVAPTQVLQIPGENARDGWLLQWVGIASGTQQSQAFGSPIPGLPVLGAGQIAGHADRSFQVVGTFGAGCNIQMQGSNDGVNWSEVTTPSGQPGAPGIPALAQFTSATGPGIMQILEACVMYRWSMTGGDGTTNLTVNVFHRKTSP